MHSARFLTAADLILDLTRQETARALQHRLRSYLRPTLLAIDEVGYLAYDAHAAAPLPGRQPAAKLRVEIVDVDKRAQKRKQEQKPKR